MSSDTLFTSEGDLMESVSAFGTINNTSFAVDGDYDNLSGDHPNGDVKQHTIYAKVKQQITAQDTILLEMIQYHDESGDVRDYYNPNNASTTLRFSEDQEPNLYLGWHRAWSESSHTLFLASRLQDTVSLNDPAASLPALSAVPNAPPTFSGLIPGFSETYQSKLSAYSLELEHIFQTDRNTLIAGGRAQFGSIDTLANIALSPTAFPPQFFGTTNPALSSLAQNASARLDRISIYAYDFWQVFDPVNLVGGIAYDTVTFPNNADYPPIAGGSRREGQISPKAAAIWDITKSLRLKADYTRSLGGGYYDSSVRLEPTEIAGFLQTFRSLIPESVAGTVPGSQFETWGLAVDKQFPKTGTYLLLRLDELSQRGDRLTGVFNYFPPAVAAQLDQRLNYRETAAILSLNQLVGEEWAFGAKYSMTYSHLLNSFPALPVSLANDGNFTPSHDINALLHELDLQLNYNNRFGIFGSLEGEMFSQSNEGYTPDLTGDTFWQWNATIGYHFAQRKATIQLALLNITDQNYQLNPLSLHSYLPRGRTLELSLHVEF